MESLYNRELSWLAFNRRVLQEAEDRSVTLMQRLRFLGIFSNNNDEFIKVRLARLLRQAQHPNEKRKGAKHLVALLLVISVYIMVY